MPEDFDTDTTDLPRKRTWETPRLRREESAVATKPYNVNENVLAPNPSGNPS